jgi:hypothetical protein
MNLQRSGIPVLMWSLGILIVRLATLNTSVLAQTNRVSTGDSLHAFVGTWIARTSGENVPFLVLKFREKNGKLSGTINQFKLAVTATGAIVGTQGTPGDSPIEDLSVSDGDLGFVWNSDARLRGDRVKFVLQGTKRAQLVIMVSAEQIRKIMGDNPGAGGFTPVIYLNRESESENEKQVASLSEKSWEPGMMAVLINTAEAQYKFATGAYGDYPTLLQSGQLKETGGREFTALPGNLQSINDPLPGFRVHLLTSANGSSYQLSIQEKAKDCGVGLFTDETGVIFEGRPSSCVVK